MTTFTQHAYGLSIVSDLELWPGEIRSGPAASLDVRIVLSASRAQLDSARFVLASRDTAVTIDGACAMRAIEGRRLEITPQRGVAPGTLAACIAGAGLAMILHQRGHFVVHGSCVAVGGAGVCIVGPSGAGKSTLATALAARGHQFLSDGMTVLRREDGGAPVALAGPRWAKLWPDSIRHFGHDADELSRVAPPFEKRLWPIAATKASTVRVRRAYLLSAGSALEVRTLAPSEGLMGIVRNAFLAEYIDPASASRMLQESAVFAVGLDVHALVRTPVFHEISRVVRTVEYQSADDVTPPDSARALPEAR